MLILIDIAHLLLTVLWWLIIIQAILSWLVAFNVVNTSNDFVRQVLVSLSRMTEPLYRPIRRIMPDFGALEFSPLVLLLLIQIVDRIILPRLAAAAIGAG